MLRALCAPSVISVFHASIPNRLAITYFYVMYFYVMPFRVMTL